MKFEVGKTYSDHYTVIHRTPSYITVSDRWGNQKRYKVCTKWSGGIETANQGRIGADQVSRPPYKAPHRPGVGWVSDLDAEPIILGYAEDICQELGLDLASLYATAYPNDPDCSWTVHQDGVKATAADIEAVLADLTDVNFHSFCKVLGDAVKAVQ